MQETAEKQRANLMEQVKEIKVQIKIPYYCLSLNLPLLLFASQEANAREREAFLSEVKELKVMTSIVYD